MFVIPIPLRISFALKQYTPFQRRIQSAIELGEVQISYLWFPLPIPNKAYRTSVKLRNNINEKSKAHRPRTRSILLTIIIIITTTTTTTTTRY